MVRLLHWIFSSLLLALVGMASPVGNAQTLMDIRLGSQEGGTRAVIELDQAVSYEAFYLSGPPRVVIDFTGLQTPQGFTPSNSSHGLIRDVRLGQFNADVIRVVLDLKESGRVAGSFFLIPQGGAAYRLVLDLEAGAPVRDGTVIAESDFETRSPQSPQSNQTPNTGQTPGGNTGGSTGATCATCPTVLLPPKRPGAITPQRYIIVIDPGHGGRDPGAVTAGGIKESDVVLEMAKEISNELKKDSAYEVYLTRGTDRLVPLSERAALARGRAADFFLSIHANANPDPNFRGFMVFVLSETASDTYAEEVASRENRAELGAIADVQDGAVGSILSDILVRDTLNQSIDFSDRLVSKLSGKVELTNKPQRRAGFVVLKSVRMPSALLEIGHLTNSREASALQQQSYRRKIATAIRQALDEYFANN